MTTLEPPAHLPADVRKVWVDLVSAHGADAWMIVSDPDLEAYCGQIARLRDAQRRIDAEGLIIADPKGVPIPHPAIGIEKAAQEQIRAWKGRFRPGI